jgi:hypothetical protein
MCFVKHVCMYCYAPNEYVDVDVGCGCGCMRLELNMILIRGATIVPRAGLCGLVDFM